MKKIIFFFVVLSCVFGIGTFAPKSYAANNTYTDKKAIIFLLDASNSMNTNDKSRIALDSIAQLIYSLPSNYSAGFVAYNTEVVCYTALVDCNNRDLIMKYADGIQYTGYTHAGGGLQKAVSILEADTASEKTIVILSDGEIVMRNETETASSSTLFQAATEAAKNAGITIHTIGLGAEMTDNENTIFSASKVTGGSSFHAPKATDIQKAIDAIITDKLRIKKTIAALVEAGGQEESLKIKLPAAHASTVRILFTSNRPINNLKADFNAGSGKQVTGVHYSLLEMDYPTVAYVNISFQGEQGSQVRVDLITEYHLLAKATPTYTDIVPINAEKSNYERTAKTQVTFYDAQNPNIQVFTDAYFEQAQLPLIVDGEIITSMLLNGTASFLHPVEKNEIISIAFDFSKLNTNIFLNQPIEVQLEAPPALSPVPPDYRPLFIGTGAGFIVLAGLVFFILWKRRHKPEPLPEPAPPPPSKYSYTGKLNIYVTRTPSGYDIPPLSYNLFRLSSSRVVSLQEILHECNVEESFEGAGKIFFKSGADKMLVLTNNSDCTLLKNREILMKNRSYQIALDTKVDITFEDEVSALAFQYKDIKPAELRT